MNRFFFSLTFTLRALFPAKFFFISLIAGLIYLSSCKKSNDIITGAVSEEDQIGLVTVDTFSIFTSIRKENHFVTTKSYSSGSNHLLGSYNDSVFGVSTASIYTQLRLFNNITNVNLGHPDSLVLDSAVLILPYFKTYYGQKTKQTIRVYRMLDTMALDSFYYSDKTFKTDPVELGSGTFAPWTDSINSLSQTTRPLRIRLQNSLGTELLGLSRSDTVSSTAKFRSYFKGIMIKPDNPSQQLGEGGIFYMDLRNTSTNLGIKLYYKNTNSTTPTNQLDYTFQIAPDCANANHFSHDYTNAPDINNVLADTTKGMDKVYVQSMAGLMTKVWIPNIKSLYANGPASINKAELIIKVDPSSVSLYEPHAKLGLVTMDTVKHDVIDYLMGEYVFGNSDYFSGKYDIINKEYRINISRHIQNVLQGKTPNRPLYIVATSAVISANRTIIGGGGNTKFPMRLRVLTTPLK